MCDITNVKLLLNWYEIEGNSLVGEETIQSMSACDLLKLFNSPFWNKLYHCWALEHEQIATLQEHVQHKIDTTKHSYFVEIYKLTEQ